LRQIGHRAAQRGQFRQRPLGKADGFNGRLGAVQAAGGPVEQAHAQLGFEFTQEHRHGRLGQRQHLCRRGQAARLVDSHEGAQLPHRRQVFQ
jgi:hypothetical protein